MPRSWITALPICQEPDVHAERVNQFETRRRRKDGSLPDISLTISPVKNALGNIIGALDRTEQENRHAEPVFLSDGEYFLFVAVSIWTAK
jgi:PAS domain-containing protein